MSKSFSPLSVVKNIQKVVKCIKIMYKNNFEKNVNKFWNDNKLLKNEKRVNNNHSAICFKFTMNFLFDYSSNKFKPIYLRKQVS